MIAAKLATRPQGDQSNTSIGVLPQPDAAALLNVSKTSVQRAHNILNKGTPEVIVAVEAGESAHLPKAMILPIRGDQRLWRRVSMSAKGNQQASCYFPPGGACFGEFPGRGAPHTRPRDSLA